MRRKMTSAALVTEQPVGEVAAVQAAAEARERASVRVGAVATARVLTRADEAVRQMLDLDKLAEGPIKATMARE